MNITVFALQYLSILIHRVSLHPALVKVVPLGLWVSTQISAFAARGNALMCKSIGRSETEADEQRVTSLTLSGFGNLTGLGANDGNGSGDWVRRFLISEMGKA
jgi:hypothetical protein